MFYYTISILENYIVSKMTDLSSDGRNGKSSTATARHVGMLSNSAITFITEPLYALKCESPCDLAVNIHVNHGEVHSIKHYPSPRKAAIGEWIRALDRKPAAV